jgi:glutaredoxin
VKITIFTTNTCAYCAMVKKYLDYKHLLYEVVNLDEHPERNAEAFEASGGALTVPITVVEKGSAKSAVVGWNVARLAQAIA